jgi:mannose/fructose-specific phosphotransferase system component IIA
MVEVQGSEEEGATGAVTAAVAEEGVEGLEAIVIRADATEAVEVEEEEAAAEGTATEGTEALVAVGDTAATPTLTARTAMEEDPMTVVGQIDSLMTLPITEMALITMKLKTLRSRYRRGKRQKVVVVKAES